MTDQVDASMIPERLIAMLSGFFGALGALLAAIGLYGLLAYTVARRTSEIGIRMALGATPRDVLAMVHKSALAMAGAGVALGVPLAFAAQRVAVTFVDNISAGSDDADRRSPPRAAIAVALARRVHPGAQSIAREPDRGSATGVASQLSATASSQP